MREMDHRKYCPSLAAGLRHAYTLFSYCLSFFMPTVLSYSDKPSTSHTITVGSRTQASGLSAQL